MRGMLKMKKGFIGPLGDDLPSLIAIMLALTLFFSGLTFAMHTFNQRQGRVRLMRGAVDISRAIVREPVLDAQNDVALSNNPEAIAIAENNGLQFNAKYGEELFGENECDEQSIHFSYLVSRELNNEIKLDVVRICVWEE